MALDPDRHRELLAVKLRALVTDRWGTVDGARATNATFPSGAGLVDRDRGWVLTNDERAVGPALVWAERHEVAELHVLVDDADVARALARRAGQFTAPPQVWHVDGRALTAATPAPPLDLEAAPPPAADALVPTLVAAGAQPLVEGGVLVAEVHGLEVARVVVDERDDDVAYLEVGVGKHDRHAQSLVHGDRPTTEALAAAVEFVARHRRPGAEPHPLNRLARERWLRAALVDEPTLVGATMLRAVSSPVTRDDLRKPAPAPAVGTDANGDPVVVVCSVGIDLDLVPAAADVRLATAPPDTRLLLAVPPGDDHPLTRRLAAALRHPAEVRAVDVRLR